MGNEKSLPDHRISSTSITNTNTTTTSNSYPARQTNYSSHNQPQQSHRRHSTQKSAVHPQRYTSTSATAAADHHRAFASKRNLAATNSLDAHSQFSSTTQSRPSSRTADSTKSYASSTTAYSAATLSTRLSSATTTGKSSTTTARDHAANKRYSASAADSKQTKYLKEQLYIKSYLDIVERDRRAREQFQPAKPGIRNYTPKILGVQPTALAAKSEVDVWI